MVGSNTPDRASATDRARRVTGGPGPRFGDPAHRRCRRQEPGARQRTARLVTVTVATRHDLTLEAYRRVAWKRESMALDARVAARLAASRAAFLSLIADGSVTVYGVTSGFGDRARVTLEAGERAEQAAIAADRGVSFGEPLPERVVRGIVFARLANLVDGHGAVRPEVAEAVASVLEEPEMPAVPVQGNGGSGEILALGHLFNRLAMRVGLEPKEGLALVNGSPCAAALLADGALAASGRIALAYETLALSVEALAAPLEAYDSELAELWGDEGEALALRRLGAWLEGAAGERARHQAPVSFRIIPRVLGQAERALAQAQRSAGSSLSSVSDNPVFIPPSAAHPRGRALSTGGYHNGAAPQMLHALTLVYADLCRLIERHVEALWMGPGKQTPHAVEEYLSLALMVVTGWSEEAALAAQPVLLPRSGPGQNDAGAPAFLAWQRNLAAGRALEACLAVLLATAGQIFLAEGRQPAEPLRPRLDDVAERCPAATHPYGAGMEDIAALLGREVYAAVPGAR
jgi:histidine ammonia-lyase